MRGRMAISLGAMAVGLGLCTLYGMRVIRGGFSSRTPPSRFEKAITATARSLAIPAHAKALHNPVAGTPEVLAEAKAHWADHCAQCHANNGSGDAEIGRNLYPRPPDMRLDATQRLTDGELYYTINNGVRLTGMPAFGVSGDDDLDSWKLVIFIRHLPQMSVAEATEMESLNPKSLDELNEEREEEEFLNGSSQTNGNTSRRKP